MLVGKNRSCARASCAAIREFLFGNPSRISKFMLCALRDEYPFAKSSLFCWSNQFDWTFLHIHGAYEELETPNRSNLCHVAAFLNKPHHLYAILYVDNQRGRKYNHNYCNALDIAVEMQHQESVNALLNHGDFLEYEKNCAYQSALHMRDHYAGKKEIISTFQFHAKDSGWVPEE